MGSKSIKRNPEMGKKRGKNGVGGFDWSGWDYQKRNCMWPNHKYM